MRIQVMAQHQLNSHGVVESVALRRLSDRIEVTYVDADDTSTIEGIEAMTNYLADYHWELYRNVYPAMTKLNWQSLFRPENQSLSTMMKKWNIFVLRASDKYNGERIGYISGSTKFKRESCSASLNHLLVMPGHQGKGVGRLLFSKFREAIEVRCPGSVNKIRVACYELNRRAQHFYLRLGFLISRVAVDYFREEDPKPFAVLTMTYTTDSSWVLQRPRIFQHEVVGCTARVGPLCELIKIVNFDDRSGRHTVQCGVMTYALDITRQFAGGQLKFDKPLHELLMLPPKRTAKSSSTHIGLHAEGSSCAGSPREPSDYEGDHLTHTGIHTEVPSCADPLREPKEYKVPTPKGPFEASSVIDLSILDGAATIDLSIEDIGATQKKVCSLGDVNTTSCAEGSKERKSLLKRQCTSQGRTRLRRPRWMRHVLEKNSGVPLMQMTPGVLQVEVD